MKTKLVTCVYNGLNQSKICGRLNRDRPYRYSLECIAHSRADIDCYTSPHELAESQSHFHQSGLSNVNFISSDLYALPFHNQVNRIRDSNDVVYRQTAEWRDRCVEIMWGKFLFIKESIERSPDTNYVFWIDAGISHPGIIHSRFNPNYEDNIDFKWDLNKTTYHTTFQNYEIFNEQFTQRLISYTGPDHILNIASSNPQHPRLDTGKNSRFRGSVIGGLFGGTSQLVTAYCDKVIEYFQHFADRGVLCKEEQIMTEILAEELFPMKTFLFNTWYHPDWGSARYSPDQISFCDFFDAIKENG